MLLGIKDKKTVFLRHLLVAGISVLLVYLVWLANSTWSPDMRLWKAFGGATFILLWVTVLLGPAAKLWQPLTRFSNWSREFGIWFALVGLVHAFLILNGWARWGVQEFLGYQYVAELDTYLRFEPGFGLANLMGLTAIILALVLAATSFDKAVSFLGVSSWKWLHMLAYVIFYLAALHVIYFAFIHFTPSPYRLLARLPSNYPVNPLRFVYVAAILSVLVAQIGAYIKTVYQQRNSDW